jgi:mevalonate kinase
MPAISASAPGKIILFGEHAVVYRRPAIAVPVRQVQVKAIVTARPLDKIGAMHIRSEAVGLDAKLSDLPENHPVLAAVNLLMTELGIARLPACSLRISSNIPVAAGLGSGAAVSVAILRALSTFLGHPLSNERICALAFKIEKLHHGTPSGIDNTVITYAMPVYYLRDRPVETFNVAKPFTIVIGDTGFPSLTVNAVGDLRALWEKDFSAYERIFDQVETIVQSARQAIENGEIRKLGQLMAANHVLLQQMTVSSPQLDLLVDAATRAGALGAKLSGAGRGGNMIALVDGSDAQHVSAALRQAGAQQTIITEVRV